MQKILPLIALLFFNTITYSQQKSIVEKQPKPFVLGVVDQISSQILGEERVLNIYLPEGYEEVDSVRYSTIYLLDGSADEDFIHVVGLVHFNSFEWVQRLPKSIVIGIASVDRRRDFTYPTKVEKDKSDYPTSGQSEKFISFIEKELQPYVDRHYKTSGSKTIIGQSLGGLFATEILFKRPELFDKYVIVSPSLWWDNGSLLSYSGTTFENKEIYIAVGKEGLTPSQIPRVMEVDANLLLDKITGMKNKNVKLFFDYLPNENHATILHQAVMNAFRNFNESR